MLDPGFLDVEFVYLESECDHLRDRRRFFHLERAQCLSKAGDEVVDGFSTMRCTACDNSRFPLRCRMIDVDTGTAAQKRIAELPFVVCRDDGKWRIFRLDLAKAGNC